MAGVRNEDVSVRRRPPLSRLLNPRSVAIAGISVKPGALGAIVLDNLERFAFSGDIHLVHPTQEVLRGRRCVKHLADLPFGVDCVVLVIPAKAVLEAVRSCAARGVGGIVIFSAGFAELGAAGMAMQQDIATLARDHDMAIEGPNCLGFVNYVDNIALTFAMTEPRAASGPGIAIVSQSGAMAAAVRAALDSRDLCVLSSISTGNEAVNGIDDFLDHVLSHAQTRVVTMVVEQIRQPRRFLELALRARARGIVIIMLHPGRSDAARESAKTHTGAMAGDNDVMRAIMEQYGVMVVETIEELIDLSDCALRLSHRPFGGVAVIGESGAYKAITLDYCANIGVALPQPQGQAAERLNSFAPGLIISSNPLDLTAQALAEPDLYLRAMDCMMAHPNCGTALITIILSSAQMARIKMPPVIGALKVWAKSRAVVFAMLGDETPISEEIIAEVRAVGVPFFRSPERALRAIARYTRWGEAQNRTVSQRAAPTMPGERLPAGVMPEHAAKDLLEKAGLRMPPRRLVASAEAAIGAANIIGFPVALKIQSKNLSHKSDVGGVILDLADEAAVRAGWDQLSTNVAAAAHARIDGVLVEHMAKPGLEIILGARNDPHWGPVVAIGLGGIFTEVIKDMRLLPADSSREVIEQQLRALRGAPLLGPYRAKPARDVDAIVSAVEVLATFVRQHPEVSEIDVNPFIVFAEGEGGLALDALLFVN
jgi:acyl-CoA synthetase (NDP forming)